MHVGRYKVIFVTRRVHGFQLYVVSCPDNIHDDLTAGLNQHKPYTTGRPKTRATAPHSAVSVQTECVCVCVDLVVDIIDAPGLILKNYSGQGTNLCIIANMSIHGTSNIVRTTYSNL